MKKLRRTVGCCAIGALCIIALAACHSTRDKPLAHDASVGLDAGATRDAQMSADPHDTARATAMIEPAAASGADNQVQLWGNAELWEHGPNVTLRLEIHGCKTDGQFRARIQAGADCSERTLLGDAWALSADIEELACSRASDAIVAYYARRAADQTPWTIGGARDSDVVGHALVLFDATSDKPVACAVIERAPDAAPSETNDMNAPTVQIRGAIAGVCVFDRLVPKVEPNCPDYPAAVECASAYCELDRCTDACASYVKCLAQARGLDTCVAAYSCEASEQCSLCQSEVVRCEQDLCWDKLVCSPPATPDGPCSKLVQCCTMNDEDPDLCRKLARLGGDADCQRLIDNWNLRDDPAKRCATD